MNLKRSEIISLADERVYHGYKIEAIVRFMAGEGVSSEHILANTGLTVDELRLPDTRISIRQLAITFVNMREHSPAPCVALRAGQHINVSNYGPYGFALQSCSSLRCTLDFSIRNHKLATPTTVMRLEEGGEFASFSFVDSLGLEDYSQFNLEFQLSLVFSLFRDILGSDFTYDSVHLNYSPPDHRDVYETILQCPVFFDQQRTEFRFSREILDKSLLKSNAITDAIVRELCDTMLAEQVERNDLTKKIYKLLLQDPVNMPSGKKVADACAMTPRTLRRRLESQGTSFQTILDGVRKELAINYLRTTEMSLNEIAGNIGYSNAANFHSAFKRWTDKTPSMYRS